MYYDGIMKGAIHQDATLAVLWWGIKISLALLHLKDLMKISRKNCIMDGIPNLRKITYIYNILVHNKKYIS